MDGAFCCLFFLLVNGKVWSFHCFLLDLVFIQCPMSCSNIQHLSFSVLCPISRICVQRLCGVWNMSDVWNLSVNLCLVAASVVLWVAPALPQQVFPRLRSTLRFSLPTHSPSSLVCYLPCKCEYK